MKTVSKFFAIALLAVLGGCVFSLHAFYTAEDLLFAPELVGAWVTEDFAETWEFTPATDKSYKLVITESGGKWGTFAVRIFRIEGHLFLDLLPAASDMPQTEYYRDHLLPVHSAVRVLTIEPDLKLAIMDPSWFEKFIAENPAAIRHENGLGWQLRKNDAVPQKRSILTANAQELQSFLIAHLDTRGAYFEPATLRRRKT
ncbi:MAG: hypothetical protein K8S22_19245 [Betaproteobacteria bacterium]|nr:hypothetical protein [Betaproteobacteria bacterium]